jgi:crotonobetainyl-CoA:carnitine CoA-transferase CaiB-like acyl-CoA transferase
MVEPARHTSSRKEPIIQQVTINRYHALRWLKAVAHREHWMRKDRSEAAAARADRWAELNNIIDAAIQSTTTDSITVQVPPHLERNARMYGYVDRRLT